uniref:Alpha-macroglobulin receptor-binding domain-containing protein n=1 Tax=Athene cunicularia TaxID=194338 RepID=A0A663LXT3_ATHCN
MSVLQGVSMILSFLERFLYEMNSPPTTMTFSFSVEQSLPVSDIKPVPVHMYDYYETDEYALTEYKTPCSLPSN